MSSAPQRTNLRVRIFRLGEEPRDDLSATTTAAERRRHCVVADAGGVGYIGPCCADVSAA